MHLVWPVHVVLGKYFGVIRSDKKDEHDKTRRLLKDISADA